MKHENHNRGGRPKSFERDKVLDAAVLVFWKKGYEGASLDDLTGAMGINRPSLYSTFGNKRDLFLAALDRYTAVQGSAQSAPLHTEPTIRAAIAGFYREIIRTVSTQNGPCGCLIASVASEVAERDRKVREKIANNHERAESFLKERFQTAGIENPALMASIVLSAGMSLAQRSRLGVPRERLLEIADGYVAHFLPNMPKTN
ncbi:MAG: TetR/AcrR family transcriptional regulator [Pseudomonadota bacterium]